MPVNDSYSSRGFFPGKCAGITLVEMLAVVAVLGVLSTVAIPSYYDAIARARVRHATENLHALILLASQEGQIRNANLSVTIDSSHWCVGVAFFPGCDCTTSLGASACVLDVAGEPVAQRLAAEEFPGVTISANFPGGGTTFNPVRRTASPGGTLAVSARDQTLEIRVGLNGRVRVCAAPESSFRGYATC
ncbi:MAG: GspH/FimT family pseudopilin [Porticoccaceae bacterium]